MLYAIDGQVITRTPDGYSGARSVPTFYLESRVQGIVSADHAVRIAAEIVNPLGLIPAEDLRLHAYPVDYPPAG